MPAEQIYQLIAEVADWPTIFPPTVHAEQLELSGDSERVRIWATANDTVKSWISRRTFHLLADYIVAVNDGVDAPCSIRYQCMSWMSLALRDVENPILRATGIPLPYCSPMIGNQHHFAGGYRRFLSAILF